MARRNPYEILPAYVLRTPILSLSTYHKLTSGPKILDKDLKSMCEDPIVSEAIFLASPALHSEIKRWLNNEISEIGKQDKLKASILKYISRMTSRCTPFGLFAGCSVGTFEEKTNIELEKASKHQRHTRLDMNFLVALSQDLIKNPIIKKQLLFYPNSSIYKLNDRLRYVEYYYKQTVRFHDIVAVDYSEYLERVVLKASEGALIDELVAILIDDEISEEEALEFIDELISNQILISELEPSVSGPEFLDQIFVVLEKIVGVDAILENLKETSKRILEIDSRIGSRPEVYIELSEHLKELETEFKLKYMFQADLFTKAKVNTLDKKIMTDLKRGIGMLNKITLPHQETLLRHFKEAFSERYDQREVEMSKVLDTETGLGYIQNKDAGDINPLIDDLPISALEEKHPISDIKWTQINSFFQKKLIKALKENANTITIKSEELKTFESTWDDLPDTMSFIIEIIKNGDDVKVKFNGGGGSSGANLLGRFCHGDKAVYEHTKKIIDIEAAINADKILAEIVHLPESRVGNILMRPDFRKYEIPYLAKSLKPLEDQLELNDLLLSVRPNGKMLLRSKKFNKEVIPHLTNAHNYSNNSLPIYHFLCDLPTQGSRGGVSFDLGPFTESYEFLPRIEYENLIIHEATWNLKQHHIAPLLATKNDDNQLMSAVKVFRDTLRIPSHGLLADRDNELLINFENLSSVRMFLESVRKRDTFKLLEFLYEKGGIVKEGEAVFTNQIIVSFYNKEKLEKTV